MSFFGPPNNIVASTDQNVVRLDVSVDNSTPGLEKVSNSWTWSTKVSQVESLWNTLRLSKHIGEIVAENLHIMGLEVATTQLVTLITS